MEIRTKQLNMDNFSVSFAINFFVIKQKYNAKNIFQIRSTIGEKNVDIHTYIKTKHVIFFLEVN